jgi:DNA repair protein RadC
MTRKMIRLRELKLRQTTRKRRRRLPITLGSVLTRPKAAADVLMRLLADGRIEEFGMLCLSTCNHVIAYHEVGRGALHALSIRARSSARLRVQRGFDHRRAQPPLGCSAPSPEDIALTKRLFCAGHALGVELAEHIVIGDRTY